MAYQIGTLTKGGGEDTHFQFIDTFKTFAESIGWITRRYVDTGTEYREWIGESDGISGTEQIFLGLKTYQDADFDYYNLNLGVFGGFNNLLEFEAQPGAGYAAVPAHNNVIEYFMAGNKQRFAIMLKIGIPVYVHAYMGKILPYARPNEFPAPFCVGGSFALNAAKRFSETPITTCYMGTRYTDTSSQGLGYLYLRDPSGQWISPSVWPYVHATYSSTSNDRSTIAGDNSKNRTCQIPLNGYYQAESLVLFNPLTNANNPVPFNVWGEFDGVKFISGFNNGVENVIQIGGDSVVDQTAKTPLQIIDDIIAVNGRAFLMGQNGVHTGFHDYIAIEMS